MPGRDRRGSERELEPRAWLTRQYEPKVLMATGNSEFWTFWKRRALPPNCAAGERSSSAWVCGVFVLETRSAMAGISNIGLTLAEMRAGSPCLSRKSMKSESVSVAMIRTRVREVVSARQFRRTHWSLVIGIKAWRGWRALTNDE